MNRRALLGLASLIYGSACLGRPPTLQPDTRATLFVRHATLPGTSGLRSNDARGRRRDCGHLSAFAKHELDLSGDTPAVLVGFSRGSGLAVVAAGQSELRPLLGGLLAVALSDEDECVGDGRTRAGRDPRNPSDRQLATMRPYDVLAGLDRLPLAVIQSTQDGYLPAAEARQLFGPDEEQRRLHAIPAGNHTFAGARDTLYEQARVALEWIVACGPGSEPAQKQPTP